MSPKVCTPLLWVLLLIASFTARTIECISDSVYNSTFDTGISFANNTAIFRQWDQQSSAVVQLKFGKLQEIDSEGVVVASHYIPALYALQPKYTSGVKSSSQNTYYTSVSLNHTFTSPAQAHASRNDTDATSTAPVQSFNSSCSVPPLQGDMAAAVNMSAPAIILQFDFAYSGATQYAYGAGRYMDIPVNASRFSIAIDNWPFCNPRNSLLLVLEVATNMPHPQTQYQSDYTMVSNDKGAPLVKPSSTRKLLAADQSIFVEYLSPAASGASNSSTNITSSTIKLLTSDKPSAAAVVLPAYGLASTAAGPSDMAPSTLVNVSLLLDTNTSQGEVINVSNSSAGGQVRMGEGSSISMVFPAGSSLAYTGYIQLTGANGMRIMMQNGSDLIPCMDVALMCAPNSTLKGTVRQGHGDATNGSNDSSNNSRSMLMLQGLLLVGLFASVIS
eukprot:jgi/Chrzof1/13413/Cz07g32040.t1